MKRFYTKLVLLAIGFSFCSPDNTLFAQVFSINDSLAYEHLQMLEDGVLLVRLQDKEKKLRLLKEAGMHARAAKVKASNDEQNAKIIDGFKTVYEYSEVYFFYSRDSKKILAKEYEGNLFYDGDEIEIDSTRHIYICDFGYSSPAGENYRYNYEGFLIQHVNNGKIEGIANDSDIFYRGAPHKLFGKGRKIKLAIGSLSYQLKHKEKMFSRGKFKGIIQNEENAKALEEENQ